MTEAVTATELAERMGVDRSRISHLLREGKLEGTYSGEGRERRFDVARVASALNMRLSLGQQTGNGARAAAARAAIADSDRAGGPPDPDQQRRLADHHARAAAIIAKAKADRAELEVADLRRRQAAQEGRWVLASEVQREVRAAIGSEIAEFEAALRMAARRIADQTGSDFREVKRILAECWREHRARRAEMLQDEAEAAQPSPVEIAAEAR